MDKAVATYCRDGVFPPPGLLKGPVVHKIINLQIASLLWGETLFFISQDSFCAAFTVCSYISIFSIQENSKENIGNISSKLKLPLHSVLWDSLVTPAKKAESILREGVRWLSLYNNMYWHSFVGSVGGPHAK